MQGLPNDAAAPAPQGQAGLGAGYFAANGAKANPADVFVKQASIRLNALGGVPGQFLTVGRIEFGEGAEAVPSNPTLASLKRDRIAQRLVGPFAFTHVGRSFDSAHWTLTRGGVNVTVLAGRPTRGVFQVDGWGELNINLLYGAVTVQKTNAEWRLFGLGYHDARGGVVKTDNRVPAARASDEKHISIGTVGGHYIRAVPTSAGPLDLLVWGALQAGSWGALDHRAGAFAAEAGWQIPWSNRLSPWVRAGYDYGSGDHDPTDARHGTFFQVLPTPRLYARFPFFNMMNTADSFGEAIVKPIRSVVVRTDVHRSSLADSGDLWYSGGGAFQAATFGFAGRPSSGQSREHRTIQLHRADGALLSRGLARSWTLPRARPAAKRRAGCSRQIHARVLRGFGHLLDGHLLDLEPAFLLLDLLERHRDLEHAVVHGRFGPLDLRTFWKRQSSVETAISPLGSVVAFALFLLLVLALSAQDDVVIGHFDRDVFLLQTRNIGPQNERMVLLQDLHIRRPGARSGLEEWPLHTEAVEQVVEITIHPPKPREPERAFEQRHRFRRRRVDLRRFVRVHSALLFEHPLEGRRNAV